MLSFTDLPAELREAIYHEVLSEVFLTRPKHPWSPLLHDSRFKMNVSLLLVDKQMNTEIKHLFDKVYEKQTTFYAIFPHSIEYSKTKLIRRLRRAPPYARFEIHVPGHAVKTSSPGNDWAQKIISAQPDSDALGLERVHHFTHNVLMNVSGLRAQLKAAGFGWFVFPGLKKRWSRSTLHAFKMLEYPPLKNNCRITSFFWRVRTRGPSSGARESRLIIEGAVKDIDVTGQHIRWTVV